LSAGAGEPKAEADRRRRSAAAEDFMVAKWVVLLAVKTKKLTFDLL
jgi:hypothetical protein